jgi:hypothetical protein
MVVPDEIQKTDLIAAVGGSEYRILFASELYMKGLANTVFFHSQITAGHLHSWYSQLDKF